jgi:hypothetical protein
MCLLRLCECGLSSVSAAYCAASGDGRALSPARGEMLKASFWSKPEILSAIQKPRASSHGCLILLFARKSK